MKSILSILLLGVLLSCSSKQSKQEQQKKADSPDGIAKFEFQQEMHNFGDLQAGEVVAFSFSFKNTGDAYLLIEKIESDCGCLNIEYPKEKIMPQETGYIEVVFNTAGEVGRVYKTIKLFTNAGQKELAITATVENKILNLYSKN
ncbi:DUF1573 domain-containing protein [Sunxiuqinia sp. A32]|uniref:DUF1573 domain-containing protein n=1 Tax=Sunxiuqinia sp. A32 TaxID=3461496 RepID=UPI004045CA7C